MNCVASTVLTLHVITFSAYCLNNSYQSGPVLKYILSFIKFYVIEFKIKGTTNRYLKNYF